MLEVNLVNCLTERQKEVLELLTQGTTYKEVAKKLFISETTVKTHMNNIFQILQVNDRTQAVVYAIKQKEKEAEALLKLNQTRPKIFLKNDLSDQERNVLRNFELGFTVNQVSDNTKLSPIEIIEVLQGFFKKLEMI